MVVRGRRLIAFCLGFIEVFIWVAVIAKIMKHMDNTLYMASYAFGFALGTFIGMTLEAEIAVGRQIVRVFTRLGTDIASSLREAGYAVTEFEGKGREGAISILFIELERRGVSEVINLARELDPDCFYIVDDVRVSSGKRLRLQNPTGWRAIMKRK